MADDVPAPDAPAVTETTPTATTNPQEDTPVATPVVTNSSRQSRPLPEETRREFFAGQAQAAAPDGPTNEPIAEVTPVPARPDLDAEDLEFKVQLTVIGRQGELATRAVTITCSGGLAPDHGGAVLAARENLTSQVQTLLKRMLNKLQADTRQLPEPAEFLMAPGPSAVAMMPPPSPDETEAEELIPRT